MADKRFGLGILAILLLVFGLTVAGCDNGTTSGDTSRTAVFVSTDAAGTEFRLTFTENLSRAAAFSPAAGDSFELRITPVSGPVQISRGVVQSSSGGNISLLPTSATTPFSITVSGGNMTGITGTITVEGGGTVSAPEGALTPGAPPTLPPGNGLAGTIWLGEVSIPTTFSARITFTDSTNWLMELLSQGAFRVFVRGTYTVDGNNVIMGITHMVFGGIEEGELQEGDFGEFLSTLSGNTLYLYISDEDEEEAGRFTFTRQ